MPENKFDKAVMDLIKAWMDESKNPANHRRMKKELRVEWPALAVAIDNVVISARRKA